MKLTRSTARRGIFAALLLAGTVFGVTSTAPATEAAAAPQGLCTYYDSQGNVVGVHGVDCCGNRIDRGLYTGNFECHVEVCVWCPPTS